MRDVEYLNQPPSPPTLPTPPEHQSTGAQQWRMYDSDLDSHFIGLRLIFGRLFILSAYLAHGIRCIILVLVPIVCLAALVWVCNADGFGDWRWGRAVKDAIHKFVPPPDQLISSKPILILIEFTIFFGVPPFLLLSAVPGIRLYKSSRDRLYDISSRVPSRKQAISAITIHQQNQQNQHDWDESCSRIFQEYEQNLRKYAAKILGKTRITDHDLILMSMHIDTRRVGDESQYKRVSYETAISILATSSNRDYWNYVRDRNGDLSGLGSSAISIGHGAGVYGMPFIFRVGERVFTTGFLKACDD